MGSQGLGHAGQFELGEHRGFSLDQFHQGLTAIPLETVRLVPNESGNHMEFDSLLSELRDITPRRPLGRVLAAGLGSYRASGLAMAALGDRVEARAAKGPVAGEIIALSRDCVTVMPEDRHEGLTLGAAVALLGPAHLLPHTDWLGRIIDPLGRPLDGRPLPKGRQRRQLLAAPPPAALRRGFGPRLSTGLAAFDTFLPLVQGQRLGLFSGSGVGKSTLLAEFARSVQVDVIVVALVGERGRELRSFTEEVLGNEGMARAVVVTATSDQTPVMRRRCLHAAMTLAEFYRDEGLQVLFLVDSVTRFAEAHREVALASGEEASLRGYPPSTAHEVMSLCERAGPGAGGAGDITAVFTVLVAGSDMEEPIADILRGTLDGHVVLDRAIAERGRHPAVDLLKSVSRSLPDCASDAENLLLAKARGLLGANDRAEMMIQAGLYVAGSDPLIDRAIALWPSLDRFLAEKAPAEGIEGSFRRLEMLLAGQV